MSQTFQKKVEDFTCEQCGVFVRGNGYTNHCPRCLWSKHVDVFPGDRKSLCGGRMRPARVELRGGETYITHVCETCFYEKRNRMSPEDDPDAVVQLFSGNKKNINL